MEIISKGKARKQPWSKQWGHKWILLLQSPGAAASPEPLPWHQQGPEVAQEPPVPLPPSMTQGEIFSQFINSISTF